MHFKTMKGCHISFVVEISARYITSSPEYNKLFTTAHLGSSGFKRLSQGDNLACLGFHFNLKQLIRDSEIQTTEMKYNKLAQLLGYVMT